MVKFRSKNFGQPSKRVVFLLTGWPTRIWEYFLVTSSLAKNNYFCIAYEYDKEILTEFDNVDKNIQLVVTNVLHKIKRLKKKGVVEFSLFGTSFGAVIALEIARKSNDIKKVVLNLPTAHITDILTSKSILVRPLMKVINSYKPSTKNEQLQPINNLMGLKSKKVLIYLAKKDQIVPYDKAKRLVDEMEKLKINHQVILNKYLTHYLAASKNHLVSSQYLQFLNKE